MEFRAEARFMRVSPQKARLVLELIKGRRVEEARNTLLFTKKRVAATVGKLLQSAIDNANFLSTEKGLDVDLDNLYVKHAVANDGPRIRASSSDAKAPRSTSSKPKCRNAWQDAKCSSTSWKCINRSSMRSWYRNRLRCNWKSAWASGVRCGSR